jgi:hypothetical protein
MQLLCGQQRKTSAKIKPHLMPENSSRSGSRPIPTVGAVRQNMIKKVEILLHGIRGASLLGDGRNGVG